jgi:hypothetical protein
LPTRRFAVALGVAGSALVTACTSAGDAGNDGGNPVAEEAAASPIVPEDQLVDGGPGPDGIPPIDDPMFVSPDEAATFLDRREPVISLEIEGDRRAYPARIMLWHEIVNDEVGGAPVAITYCPLCNTGVVFRRPDMDGELLDFGTSGKLYHSNLVMYDRQTTSLWPQALGRAIRGPLLGEELELVPSQIVSFGEWSRSAARGRVLSLETGHERDYGRNPYVGYDEAGSPPFALIGDVDPRLPAKERVVGLRDGEEALAVPYPLLEEAAVGGWAAVPAQVGERPVVVFWHEGTRSALDAANIERSKEVGATGSFSPVLDGRTLTFTATADGIVDDQTDTSWDLFGRGSDGPLAGRQLDPVVAVESFWFDWAAFFSGTAVLEEDT